MITKFNLALLFSMVICVWTLDTDGKLFCYYGSWSTYRPSLGKFDISNIQLNLCTHLIYAFAGVDQQGKIRVLDAWQDLPDNYGLNGFQRFNDLKKSNSHLRTLLAIGGWNHGSPVFSALASSPSSRENFANNVIEFVKKYGFDGIDLAWLYPNQRGGHPQDKENYILLLKELYPKFKQNNLILSAAVGAIENSARQSYIIKEMHQYLDYINLMSYDMRGIWDKKTGVNAPLHSAPSEIGPIKNVNVESAVKYWLSEGAPPGKIILGIPLFGKSFTLSNNNMHSVGSPILGAGYAGPYTGLEGMLSYQEVCANIVNNGWTEVYDPTYEAPYAFMNNQWVGYEDERSIKAKVNFTKEMKLGGINAWEMDFDDFLGSCHKGPYPLLNAIKFNLWSSQYT